MKTIRILPALLVTLLCTSCVPLASFFPLWDEQHAGDIAGLQGTWIGSDGGSLVFAKKENGSYLATLADKKESSLYEARIVSLNGKFFLDFYPDEATMEKRFSNEAYLPLIPAHFFARVAVKGDTMEIEVMDDEKVENKEGINNPALPILKRNDQLMLAADTKTLQNWIIALKDDPSVWNEKDVFTRKKY